MLLCKLLMVAVIIFVLLAFRETDAIAALANSKAIYQAGAYMVIVSLLFIYLALNGIKKDEELVRSADRLR
jgi:membrane protease YdiL (CAAX protease family)